MKLRLMLLSAFLGVLSPTAVAQTVLGDLYYPLVLDGPFSNTKFVIAHAGGESRWVFLRLLDSSGSALAIPTLTINQTPGMLPNCGTGCFAFAMGPGDFQSLTAESPGGASFLLGYAKVTISSPNPPATSDLLVNTSMLLNHAFAVVNVPSQTDPRPAYNYAFLQSAATSSALVALNPHSSAATLRLRLFDNSQVPNLIDTRIRILNGGASLSSLLSEFFSSIPPSGKVTADSDIPLFLWPLQVENVSARVAFVPSDVTVHASQGVLAPVTVSGNPSPTDSPAGVSFPAGFFQFQIGGLAPAGATTVTMSLPPGTAANTYFKFGPTPSNPVPHWYEFLFDGATGALIFPDRIELHFVDGLRGDDDLLANGTVLDPSGPAFRNVLNVAIDIKPGSSRNPVNLREKGVLPVAMLAGGGFDVTSVDVPSVRFGATGTEASVQQFGLEDVNGDGLVDLIMKFEVLVSGFGCSDTEGVLKGKTKQGLEITGRDSISPICR